MSRPPRAKPIDNLDLLINRYNGGENLTTLASELKTDRKRLRQIFIANKVILRSYSERLSLRMNKLSITERKQIVSKAHEANRGKKRPKEHVQKAWEAIALSREKNKDRIGEFEIDLNTQFQKEGLLTTPQKAVDIYNIDIAINKTAVEIHNNSGNPAFSSKNKKRTKKLNELGWSVCYLWIKNKSKVTPKAMNIIKCFVNSENKQNIVIRESGDIILDSFKNELAL